MKTCKCGLCGKEVDCWAHVTMEVRGRGPFDTVLIPGYNSPVREYNLCLECAGTMLKGAEFEDENQKEKTE